MPETFILIPGRTSRQGTSLEACKLEAEYVEEKRVRPQLQAEREAPHEPAAG